MKTYKKFFIATLFVTLPITLFFIVLLYNSIQTYFAFDRYELTMSKGARLQRVVDTELHNLLQKTKNLFGVSKKVDVELIVPDKAIRKLNADLPISGMEHQDDSYMIIDGKAIKGKVKYRGDHYYHWAFPDKSWRFRTSKKNIHNGIHKYNFITPKNEVMLYNHMSYKLAKMMGLLAPDSKLVELSVNGVYSGPKLMVEQIDESFLRKNQRMPNDIYKGDNIGAATYIGTNNKLFNTASIWEKAAYNNHYAKDSLAPLAHLIADIHGEQNQKIVDLKAFAAMAAYIDLTGSYHHDETHNWMLLYDAYFERMFPIVWDTVGWLKETVNKGHVNLMTAEFLRYLYNNQDFRKLKIKHLKRFFTEHEADFYQLLDENIERSREIITNNGFAYDLGRKKFSIEEAEQEIEQFRVSVKSRLETVKSYFVGPANPEGFSWSHVGENHFRFKTSDPRMVNALHFHFDQPVQENLDVKIKYHQDGQWHINSIASLVNQSEQVITIPVQLLAGSQEVDAYPRTKLIDIPVTYDIIIPTTVKNLPVKLIATFENINNQSLDIIFEKHLPVISHPNNHSNILHQTINNDVMVLSGEITVTQNTTYEQKVEIKPGTRFLLSPDVVLKFNGKVMAAGTAEAPITFHPADPTSPWGAVVIKDEMANGSRFSHCEFVGGSGAKGKLYEYTAMLSIHNVKDISFDHCEFYDSKITDDMIHVIYSEATFSHSKFVRSLSDALDADISQLTINDSEFIDSGNDSIDLMTSQAIVQNTRFIRSADKGISIGEGSQLVAYNNYIENSEIGMQSKDTSMAYIYNTQFIGNVMAIDAYHKNWRYSEGGQIVLHKCVLANNKSNATVDKKSSIILNQCEIDDDSNINKKDLQKQRIKITNQEAPKVEFDHAFFKTQLKQFNAKDTNGSD